MPDYGLGVWGPDGTQWVGGPDRICRYEGSATWGNVTGGASVFLSFPGFRTDGTWFYFAALATQDKYEDVGPTQYNLGGEGYLVPGNDGITFYCTMTANGLTRCANYIVYVWRG